MFVFMLAEGYLTQISCNKVILVLRVIFVLCIIGTARLTLFVQPQTVSEYAD